MFISKQSQGFGGSSVLGSRQEETQCVSVMKMKLTAICKIKTSWGKLKKTAVSGIFEIEISYLEKHLLWQYYAVELWTASYSIVFTELLSNNS